MGEVTKKTYKKSALCSAILGAMGSAHGATIFVDENCSLVEAMQTANIDLPIGSCVVGSGNDVIQVVTPDSEITINTIFESSAEGPGDAGLPVVISNITIEGNGLIIRADNASENFRLFDVAVSGDLTLRDTTVTGADDGYGIGSGLFSYGGRVTIENSTFALNNGAILIGNSTGNEINNSVIRHNANDSYRSAGLQTYFSQLSINQSSFVDNKHYTTNFIRGISNTTAGGAGLFQSEVTITNSTFSGNESLYGSGLFISDDVPLSLPSRSARFGNSSLRGIINSSIEIINSTITNNKGYIGSGIVENGYYTNLTIQGSVVAGNQVYYGFAPNIFSYGNGNLLLDANNIIGDMGASGSFNVTLGASDSSFINDAKDNLYPLTLANGQLMHPLKVGSAAIDGNDLFCYGSIIDQEGKGRGKDGDDDGSFICDVGSFEHTLPILADGAPCTFSNALLSAENDSSVGGCRPGNGHDIIELPEDSTQTFSTVVDLPDTYFPSPYFTFGIPGIQTAITIEGNGSVIERDSASLESFDLIYVDSGGQLNLIDAHVTGANGGLGAVTAWYGGNMNIIDSNISGNQSLGLFDFRSINSSVTNTTVSQNAPTAFGEGYNFSPLTTLGSVGFELRQSTISNNTGYIGGGVDFRGVTLASMDNTTVSGNTAIIGGLSVTKNNYGDGSATIRNSTITGNTGSNTGGIYADPPNVPGLLTLSHSVVSGNVLTPPPVPSRAVRSNNLLAAFSLPGTQVLRGGPLPTEIFSDTPNFDLSSYNIIGQNGDAGTVGAVIGGSSIIPDGATSTVIETTLADNGGDTLTHLPVDGGLAVDGGTVYCDLNEDQLGRIRPWDGDGDSNANCDIGAVELGSIAASDIIFKDGFDASIIIRRTKFKD